MAKNIQIQNVIIQYCFLERVNPISNKFSFECLIPQDHPQVQDVMAACSAEWAAVGAGQPETAAQSIGYNWTQPNDSKHIHPDVAPMLDPNKQYMRFRGVQDANVTPDRATKIYANMLAEDGVTLVTGEVTNRSLIGDGTIANVSLNAFGYQASGQKGVKLYGQWIQIVDLKESKYAGANTPPPAAANGYVAPAEAFAPVAAPAADIKGETPPNVEMACVPCVAA